MVQVLIFVKIGKVEESLSGLKRVEKLRGD
jgi:hypothetical protein